MRLGRVAAVTDAGRKRRRNEDAFVCEPPLFAVADGMGGAQAGELASRLAVAGLLEDAAATVSSEEDRVAALIRQANRRVYERSSEDRAASGMGTTMTVALVEDGLVRIGHVGDSRAYLIRDERLEQLTEDHSLVGELLRSGKLSPEEAESHPQRSVITRALGTEPEVAVDSFAIEAAPRDIFLLCSDGLTSMIDDETILGLVEHNRDDLQAAARALVGAANRNGGEDNITVVCFEITDAPAEPGDTASFPAVATAEAPAEEEDTLSGLEQVPPVETLAVAPGHVDEWLAPDGAAAVEPVRTRRWRLPGRRLKWTLVGLGSLAVAAALGIWALSQAHFVGVEADGHVGIYQGVPWTIVDNVHLYRTVYVSPLLAAQLSEAERRRLFDHDLTSYDSARAALRPFEQDIVP